MTNTKEVKVAWGSDDAGLHTATLLEVDTLGCDTNSLLQSIYEKLRSAFGEAMESIKHNYDGTITLCYRAVTAKNTVLSALREALAQFNCTPVPA